MSFSLFQAVKEKKKTGKSTGLILFAIALTATASLLSYTKLRYGYFM